MNYCFRVQSDSVARRVEKFVCSKHGRPWRVGAKDVCDNRVAGALLKCDEEASSNESPASLGLLAAFAWTVHSWNIASCDKRLRSRSMRLCFERTCYTWKGRKVEKKEKRENSGRGERRREKRRKMYRTQDATRMAAPTVDHTCRLFSSRSLLFERIQDSYWCRREFWLNSNYRHHDRNATIPLFATPQLLVVLSLPLGL